MARILRASAMPKSVSATNDSIAHLPRIVVCCKCFSRDLRVRARASDASISLDYHDTLGVSFGASKIEIKRAYRRLARRFHPDVCKDDGSDQWFKRINHAYESLMDRSCCASVSISATFCSEAGYQSLEDLLNSEMGDFENGWSAKEDGGYNTFIDCSWLKVSDPQEIVDASIFTTAPELEEQTEPNIGWFTGEFEASNFTLC